MMDTIGEEFDTVDRIFVVMLCTLCIAGSVLILTF
jgi:hypothetical protein